MHLAKQRLDVGTSTMNWEAAQAFWADDVGVVYQEYLKIGGRVRQHRFGAHGSVIKVNHSRDPLVEAATIYRRLRLASASVAEPTMLAGPDGVSVELVPSGFDDIVGIEIVTVTADPAGAERFWVAGVGGTAIGPDRYQVGDSLVRCIHDPARPPMVSRQGLGFRYLTVQVFDVEREHAHMLELGFDEVFGPVTLGDTARISFVRDADGGFVEISQRASLTGPLPWS